MKNKWLKYKWRKNEYQSSFYLLQGKDRFSIKVISKILKEFCLYYASFYQKNHLNMNKEALSIMVSYYESRNIINMGCIQPCID